MTKTKTKTKKKKQKVEVEQPVLAETGQLLGGEEMMKKAVEMMQTIDWRTSAGGPGPVS